MNEADEKERSMEMRSRAVRFAALALVAGAAVACGTAGGATDGLSGVVNGDGSSTVYPITEAVAEEFRQVHPGVDVTVGVSGTGGGFERFCNGETDIQNASRPIKAEEEQACAAEGVSYVELTVANDGLAVVANPSNDWVSCLTTGELKRIWEPESSVRRWSQVRAGFPDLEIKLFGPGTDSGTFDYFTDAINGEEGASRTDYTPSEDDNVLVQGVAGEEGALGHFGFAYYTENRDMLKLVEVDDGDGCVAPSDETVRDGTYRPLSRPLFLYVRTAAVTRPEVETFVTFYLANAGRLVGDVGYTALDDQTLSRERAEWQAELA